MSQVIDLQQERMDREVEKVIEVLQEAMEAHKLSPEHIKMIDKFLAEFDGVVEFTVIKPREGKNL